MPKTRQEILEEIQKHENIINSPSSDRERVSASRLAIQALEYDLKRFGDNWGTTPIPIIRNREEFEALKKQASQGDPELQYIVGIICSDYSRAEFFDFAEAMYWHGKAAEQGHPKSQWNLGVAYFQGLGGIEKDLDKAEQLLLKSARAGDADGQYVLGGFYFGKPDIVKAEYWIEKSAGQGHQEAAAMLGPIKLLSKTNI